MNENNETEIDIQIQIIKKTIDDLDDVAFRTMVLWPEDPNYAYAKDLQKHSLKNFKPVKEFANNRIGCSFVYNYLEVNRCF